MGHLLDAHRLALELDLNPDNELRLCWELPLQALPYWLKGAPSPQLPVESLELDSERDLLRALQQDDWQIDYLEYEDFHGLTLPTRLQIQRASTVVKIILRDWQTHQGE